VADISDTQLADGAYGRGDIEAAFCELEGAQVRDVLEVGANHAHGARLEGAKRLATSSSGRRDLRKFFTRVRAKMAICAGRLTPDESIIVETSSLIWRLRKSSSAVYGLFMSNPAG
jgi:hypothetical protein